ncbi:hypothetical protein PICMEDRAFT_18111 [Pichia membranifaciens NRRL Y-2026]|uniref:Glycerophosphocholine acyltransferase 1 n=1 Tax=Pichia membranifaciens NRRL Y-2026 TaxID=763406 RepID=A0A1E3NEZ6_9ASCO|nr:hypothetical protein PICMEDRAFT_18111 [Pichia membranifaciens NRRL Y-2026]ODQ44711.1 hypothetical protein PICMEDRAFT_18111 [Pichia membranifaciens NRRL Y-2026]
MSESAPVLDRDNNGSSHSSHDTDSDSVNNTPYSFFQKTPNLEGITLLDLLEPASFNIDLKKKRDETYKWVHNYYKEKKKSVNLNMKKLNMSSDELLELKKVLHERIDKAYTRIDQTQKASTTEKIFFSISVYMIFFFGYLIGNHPQYVHVVYSIIFTILMPIRLITYYKIGYGYYLADLCYYVNFLLMLYIWVLPQSQMLFVTCCSFSWGTLSFAVITWKNKLVFHSVDKITSTFIHVLPGVIMYVITHQLPYEYKLIRFNGSIKLQHWDIMYGIFNTSILYFVWQLCYHYFITIRKADKIKKGKVTSFEYLRKAFAKKPIGKFVNSLPEPFPVVAFTIIQYGYQLITMSVCPFLYSYKHVCSLFVSFIFLCATYNGATYYVDFYGKKFQREVVKLQGEIESLQQEQGSDQEKKGELEKNKVHNEQPGDGISATDTQRRRTTPVTVSEIIG